MLTADFTGDNPLLAPILWVEGLSSWFANQIINNTWLWIVGFVLLDVGGGSGGLAIALTESHPQLRATVVDLALVTPFTERFVEEANAVDRVEIVTADVVRDGLSGSFDVAVASKLTQVLSPDEIRATLANVANVLDPGGVIHLVTQVLDDSRLSPEDAVGFNLVFLNIYDHGQAYTEQEYRDWLAEAGFVDFERVPLPSNPKTASSRRVSQRREPTSAYPLDLATRT